MTRLAQHRRPCAEEEGGDGGGDGEVRPRRGRVRPRVRRPRVRLSRRARRCDPTAACASGCAARPAPPPRAGAMGRSRRRSWRRLISGSSRVISRPPEPCLSGGEGWRRPWQSRSPPAGRRREVPRGGASGEVPGSWSRKRLREVIGGVSAEKCLPGAVPRAVCERTRAPQRGQGRGKGRGSGIQQWAGRGSGGSAGRAL